MRVRLAYLPQHVSVNGALARGVSHQMTGDHNLPAIHCPAMTPMTVKAELQALIAIRLYAKDL